MKILDDFGYADKKQEKILNSYAVGRYSLDNLEGKIINTFDFFRKMNYSDNDIISMTVLNPTMFNYSSKTLKNRFGFLDCLGYSKEEVYKMTLRLPQLLTVSEDYILSKLELLKSYGYSKK